MEKSEKIQGELSSGSLLFFFSSPHTLLHNLHSIHIPLLSFARVEMASSLRIGTSALRAAVAKPIQSATLNGARCYSAKAKVRSSSFGKLN